MHLRQELMRSGARIAYRPDDEGAGGGGDTGEAAAGAGDGEATAGAGTGGAGDGNGDAAAGADSTAGAVAKPDWRDARIAKLTGKLREAEEAKASAEAALAAAGNGRGSTETQAEFDKRVAEAASRLVNQREFDRACEGVATAGREAFPDFDAKVGNLQRLVNNRDPQEVQAYGNLLQAAVDSGEGAKILHMLGSDLNEAARVLALSPVKMGLELAKLAGAVPPKGDGSAGLPKPIRTVADRGASREEIKASDPDRADKLDIKTWMARREKDLAESSKARH